MRLIRLFESLSDDERMDLQLLQHDKELTGADYSAKMPALEKAFTLYGRPCRTPLYRGLPMGRGNASSVRGVLSFRGYTSFSESIEQAEKFAEESRVIVELTRPRTAFCYYEWVVSEVESLGPEEYDVSDGDWTIQAAREEAEWIFPFQSRFTVIDERPNRDGLKIVRVA